MMNQPRESWTPTITFATPGDLSVTYGSQQGFWAQSGSVLVFNLNLNFVPTYTSASGNFYITGLPTSIFPDANGAGAIRIFNGATWPGTYSQAVLGSSNAIVGGQTIPVLTVIYVGAAAASTLATTTSFPSGTVIGVQGTLTTLLRV